MWQGDEIWSWWRWCWVKVVLVVLVVGGGSGEGDGVRAPLGGEEGRTFSLPACTPQACGATVTPWFLSAFQLGE